MSAKHVGLGRGLGALIKEAPIAVDQEESPSRIMVPIKRVQKSTFQPRQTFDQTALNELICSVKEHGVLQPLLVRQKPNHAGKSRSHLRYELIAGERRLRAAQEAQLLEVPVIIMDVSDRQALELALIENLQRHDLSLVEEAEGYRSLVEDFDLTQEEVAQRVGKARTSVSNALRLLSLPEEVKDLIVQRQLSAGHAKVLLGLTSIEDQSQFAQKVITEGWSVRHLEQAIQHHKKPPRKPRAQRKDVPHDHLHYLSERLQRHFSTGVRIAPSQTLTNGKKVKGSIEIDFYSNEELDRLLELMGISEAL